jgi:uroporphyrinogen III methyltransferase / synthase
VASALAPGLVGKRVLVTRSRQQASALVALLAERGARPIELPTIEVREPTNLLPLDAAIAAIETYNWVIFTSTNGVRAFADRIAEQGRTPAILRGIRIGAVGSATAFALSELGLTTDLCPRSFVAESVVADLRQFDLRGSRVLLPQAQNARDVLAVGLTEQGATVDRVAAYRTVGTGDGERARRLFADREIDIVTLTSSSIARNLVGAIGNNALELIGSAIVASIGPITSQTARELGLTVSIEAQEHTIPGLVRALETRVGGTPSGG